MSHRDRNDRWLVRPARADEADALSALAMRSKAVWGYSAAFMERCRHILTVTPDAIRAGLVHVGEDDGGVGGFYALGSRDRELEIALLFVEPARLRHGLGAVLMRHAREQATSRGYARLFIESDPGAEGFYVRCGARRIGSVSSDIVPGRKLPLLLLELSVSA